MHATWSAQLRKAMEKMLTTLREGKLNIVDGHLLFGVADPTGILPEGVVLPIVRGKELARPVDTSDAERAHYLVYKPPGCHPGDVIKPKRAEDEVVAAFKREIARGLPIERCDAHR